MTARLLILCTVTFFITLRGSTCAKNAKFHNVLPPIDPTPFPNSFKCFTCEKSSDNYNCNRWAEDKWCPPNTHYCKTVHHFTGHGKSKSVTKKCATREECHNVGCRHHRDSGHVECVSCCDGMICNMDVPTNHTNAVLSLMRTHRKSDAHRVGALLPAVAAAVLCLVIL
ncbi:ly6/PLAUR domain-containing protein 6B [Engystomops pustulosus]|uniref:ly6/PLAUR domain-containing protein 6B n=1 Tax=Engystomops pustulosus TaxID=76066 RepID=UPI003AFA6B31